MDVLRTLTRGITNGPRYRSHKRLAEVELPSAGSRPNPQLFNDDVRPQKRPKPDLAGPATEASVEPEPQAGDEDDIDIFSSRRPGEQRATTSDRRAARETKLSTAGLLSDEECRQILRSHRLKISVLANHRVDKHARKKSDNSSVDGSKNKKKARLSPQPLTSFSQLRDVYRMSPRLCDNLASLGYQLPTEVQMGSLPLLLRPDIALSKSASEGEQIDTENGVDFLAVAPTGSGKTLSFLIPAMDAIIRRRAENREQKDHRLEVVVVVPTRELGAQMVGEAKRLAHGTGVRVVAMRKGMNVVPKDGPAGEILHDYGMDDESGSESEEDDESEDGDDRSSSGDDNDDQREMSHKKRPDAAGVRTSQTVTKADILITTPLMLLHSLAISRTSRVPLSSVRLLVLDEADVLLDPLFRDQTLAIWASCTNPSLRVTLWSATMGASIESLVVSRLSQDSAAGSPGQVTKRTRAPLIRLVVGLKDTAVPNVSHRLIYAGTEAGKLLAIRQLLHPTGATSSSSDKGTRTSPGSLRPPFLVFTQTIARAASLADELRYDLPLSTPSDPDRPPQPRVAALHAGLSPARRAKVVARFRRGEVWVLVTTDVLARGIDFRGVNGVVNYDVPQSAAAYVHRAGRTGRAGRKGGVCVTLYTEDDIPYVRQVVNVIKASEEQAAGTSTAAGEAGSAVQQWMLDALPKVSKEDRKRLRKHGVESRNAGSGARITTKSAWERRRENNRRAAVEASKRRKERLREREKQEVERRAGQGSADVVDDGEWSGFGDD